jgi:hypothetical protein
MYYPSANQRGTPEAFVAASTTGGMQSLQQVDSILADLDADRRDDRADAPLGWSVKQWGDIRSHPRVPQLGRHAVQAFGCVSEYHQHHLIVRNVDDPEGLESLESAHLLCKLALCTHEQSWLD